MSSTASAQRNRNRDPESADGRHEARGRRHPGFGRRSRQGASTASLGWRLDADFAAGDDFRVIQFTPPGSGCSVIFGKNVTAAAPGSAQGLYLIVSDIEAARDELLGRGVEVSEVFHDAGGVVRRPGRALPVRAAPGRRSGSRASQLPLVRLVQRSGRQRLAVPGGHRAIARTRGRGRHDLHLADRARGRAATCGGRARRAREADRPARCGLAGLVRRVHRPGAGRRAAAVMSSGPGGPGFGSRKESDRRPATSSRDA